MNIFFVPPLFCLYFLIQCFIHFLFPYASLIFVLLPVCVICFFIPFCFHRHLSFLHNLWYPPTLLVSPPRPPCPWLSLTFEGEWGSTQLTKGEAMTSQQTWYTSICSGLKIHTTGRTQSVCRCTQHLFPPPRAAKMAQLLYRWGLWAHGAACCWLPTGRPWCVQMSWLMTVAG